MEKIKNTQNIKEIVMRPTVYTKCVIGQDWYKSELTITFVPGDYYPDYMEVNEWLMDNIDGMEMNIEDVVDEVYNILKEYEPLRLEVKNDIKDCKTHFDVTVIK